MHGPFQKRPHFGENTEIWPRYWPSKLKSRFLPPSFSRPTSISKWVGESDYAIPSITSNTMKYCVVPCNTPQYQAIPRNTMLYHATQYRLETMQLITKPFNIMQWHAISCIIMQYLVVLCSTIHYHAIPCNTMQYLATPHKTMQNNAITCNTIKHYALTYTKFDTI